MYLELWRKLVRSVRDVGYFCSAFVLIVLITTVSACGGGGGSGATPDPVGASPDTGQLIVGITDAEGDFLIYDISIEALTLTHRNGDVVEALPIATRIDFAELTEVTEFLSLATVPAGIYESVTVRLDFTDAEIVVEDSAGTGQMAQAFDTNGAPLGVVDVDLQLSTSDVVRVQRGIPAAFSLYFDLSASNTVDFTVEPFLLATPELETDREHRVRGLVRSVDEANNQIDILIRPFRHRTGDFGELTLHVNDETIYEVDGEGYSGSEGLTAVAGLAPNAPIKMLGQVNAADDARVFNAHTVVAGSSVPWSDADVLRGVVTSREGNVLTVGGAAIEFADGRRAFCGEFFVNLDDETIVSAPGDGLYSTASISVGQRVLVWGEFVDDRNFDADRVRMHVSWFTGEVTEAGPLVVDLFGLSGRSPGRLNFHPEYERT